MREISREWTWNDFSIFFETYTCSRKYLNIYHGNVCVRDSYKIKLHPVSGSFLELILFISTLPWKIFMYVLCVLYKITIDTLWTVHCNDIWYLMLAKFFPFFVLSYILSIKKCFPVIQSHSAT